MNRDRVEHSRNFLLKLVQVDATLEFPAKKKKKRRKTQFSIPALTEFNQYITQRKFW